MTTQYYQDSQFAKIYQDLVEREDYENNLLPAIQKISPLHNKDVLELGAGTGRVGCLLAPYPSSLIATDISSFMLSRGKINLQKSGLDNWHLTLAAHQALPFSSNTFDLAISGWSFHGVALDSPNNWQATLAQALMDVARVLRPGGKVILIESLGTGFETPHTPADLADYLVGLKAHGFTSTWIRTDYCFKDKVEAQDLTTFFFRDAPMPMWKTEKGVIVPECTGLWWKTLK
ncbi:MAG: class I SAM-dependent methyltransferase [Chloroflexota bacterium]|nr:class I SAM-dependent methyltransferase [Chloroflexota bacterium]